jgi:hypothetical protein
MCYSESIKRYGEVFFSTSRGTSFALSFRYGQTIYWNVACQITVLTSNIAVHRGATHVSCLEVSPILLCCFAKLSNAKIMLRLPSPVDFPVRRGTILTEDFSDHPHFTQANTASVPIHGP